ncbi:hypothetical protein ACLB1T_09025 [Escherichia coli]
MQPAPGTTSAENTQQDVSLPPISARTEGQTPAATRMVNNVLKCRVT